MSTPTKVRQVMKPFRHVSTCTRGRVKRDKLHRIPRSLECDHKFTRTGSRCARCGARA